jgi:endonuclease/exonuclease/phosphatase family metal-dependent hydrolase
MRVLTYNIAGNKGGVDHLRRVAELICKTGVEVVGLQEVVHRAGLPDPEKVLGELTGMHAEFLQAHRHRGYVLGNAILTREPIRKRHSHPLPHAWPERRVLLEVETTTAAGLPVTVFCTHLVHLAYAGRMMRRVQAAAVAKRMSACQTAHFLVGDLNASPQANELHPLRKITMRHDHLKGLRSWPARRPLLLYDHIWPGPGWEVEEVEVLNAHVSAHRPLLAQLGWKGAAPPHIPPSEAARAEAEAFTESMMLDS